MAYGLFLIAYPSAHELLWVELQLVYNQLCHDDMPTMPHFVISNLGNFAPIMEPLYFESNIMTFFMDLALDGM